ncbi:hypothetical protein ACJX0J_007591, partial [Zea mays]
LFEKKETDVKRIADLEYALSIQVGLHISEFRKIHFSEWKILFQSLVGRKNEKGSHTALEVARKAKEDAEHERLIGIFGALDITRIANEAIDEAVNRLLNEAADETLFIKTIVEFFVCCFL